jgi:DNA-binding LacI/PurR family transcriptional regulator
VRNKVTSQDVAELAGVSRTTVSFVLNDVKHFNIMPETRQKVLEAIETLGYVPNASAQALASKRSKAIGLVMTRSPQYIATDTFMPQILGGMLDIIKSHRLGLLIEWVNPGHQIKTYRELIHAKHIDGMILLTPRYDDEGLKELEDLEIPVVLMGNVSNSSLPSVDIDNRLAAKRGVDHLIELGHRQIACILNAPLAYSSANERLMGYQDALADASIAYDQDLVRIADFDPQSGFLQMKSLLSSGESFTAVFVASDNVAMGALAAIHETGLQVPGDLSVLGFDDIPWANYATPPLTTIHTPAHELSQQSCLLLLELMKEKTGQTRKVTIDSELVIRKSTQRINT